MHPPGRSWGRNHVLPIHPNEVHIISNLGASRMLRSPLIGVSVVVRNEAIYRYQYFCYTLCTICHTPNLVSLLLLLPPGGARALGRLAVLTGLDAATANNLQGGSHPFSTRSPMHVMQQQFE